MKLQDYIDVKSINKKCLFDFFINKYLTWCEKCSFNSSMAKNPKLRLFELLLAYDGMGVAGGC